VPYSPSAAVGRRAVSQAPRIVTTATAGFAWRSAAIGGDALACVLALIALAAAGIARITRARAVH
jgi:hypothetical protein